MNDRLEKALRAEIAKLEREFNDYKHSSRCCVVRSHARIEDLDAEIAELNRTLRDVKSTFRRHGHALVKEGDAIARELGETVE